MSTTKKDTKEKLMVLSWMGTYLNNTTICHHRQIIGLTNFTTHVYTMKLLNRDTFPFDEITVLQRPRNRIYRLIRRIYYKHISRKPKPLALTQVYDILNKANNLIASVVHVYMGTEAVRILSYLRREKRPKLVSFHGVDTRDDFLEENFNDLLECVDLFLVRSKHMKGLLEARGCSPERIILNTTGVPIPDKPIKTKSLNFSAANPLRIVQACRLIEKKGLDVTVRSIREVKKVYSHVQLDIIGDGVLLDELKKLVSELDLESNVQLLGHLKNDELLARLDDYHLFVHPSRQTNRFDREGIPNSMLEAMAHGLPVVATPHAGIPEVIIHGKNGMLSNSCHSGQIASLILEVVSNQDNYLELSAHAARTVAEHYSIEKNILRLEEAYSRALSLKVST
ncbi:MAG: glycosyltransferase [Coraliomargaritaceae bacterium]